MLESKNTLKEKKKVAKDLAQQVNDIKSQMDELKSILEAKNEARSALKSKGLTTGKIVLDEEEYDQMNQLKLLKESYKNAYNELKSIRSEIENNTAVVDHCRQKVMTEFEQWNETIYGGNNAIESNSNAEDVLDIGEKFDRLQLERMSQEDPDSLPYYNAKKNTERKIQKV